jgi:hypothetical protein
MATKQTSHASVETLWKGFTATAAAAAAAAAEIFASPWPLNAASLHASQHLSHNSSRLHSRHCLLLLLLCLLLLLIRLALLLLLLHDDHQAPAAYLHQLQLDAACSANMHSRGRHRQEKLLHMFSITIVGNCCRLRLQSPVNIITESRL